MDMNAIYTYTENDLRPKSRSLFSWREYFYEQVKQGNIDGYGATQNGFKAWLWDSVVRYKLLVRNIGGVENE